MSCNFRVGQKVAAIQDFDCGISKGEIFTISAIDNYKFLAYDGTYQSFALFFAEREPSAGYSGFDPRFFRPVIERKTDISVFKAMLNPQKTSVSA